MNYRWNDQFLQVPDTPSSRSNGRTHGIAELSDGRIALFHQAKDGLALYAPDGGFLSASGDDRWMGAHGLTRVRRDEADCFWLTDELSGEVALVTPDGETMMRLDPPDHPAYRSENAATFKPTWVAEHPENGRIWVADGYGASLLHVYEPTGEYLHAFSSIDGMPGDLRCPHGIAFHRGTAGPELWVADRGNQRILVLDGEGRLLRSTNECHSPCGFDFHDGVVVVPELHTGLKFFEADTLRLLGEFGNDPEVVEGAGGNPEAFRHPDGWPNLAGTPHVRPGVFNSPHAACFCRDGSVLAVEWIIGGRVTKLTPEPA